MAQQEVEIQVFADWLGLGEPIEMGTLQVQGIKGREVYSFEYAKEWLQREELQQLDPDLQFYQGRHYLPEGKQNFGIFLDSSPDRWGRVLMDRREALMAKMEGRTKRKLFESDYLLGVFDRHRMGAFRFKLNGGGPFLDDNEALASPPWTSLRELEAASFRLEEDDAASDPDYHKWLKMLVAPGSSLGGARPKSSVIDKQGALWIAKFPSLNDGRDMGAWELLANRLAKAAGLEVPEVMAQKFGSKYHTLLSKRFDRNENGQRLHFSSAMTMLGYRDGNNHESGVSYLELAEFLIRFGDQTPLDLEELWRRIVFNIAITNTDDHLRNHGFMLAKQGWRLSPAYDLNPTEGTGLSLNISEDDNSLDFDLALEVSGIFQLKLSKAKEILAEVVSAVGNWQKEAKHVGISNAEQDLMADAFKIP